MGKEEGEAAGSHCDKSSFISVQVRLFVCLSLFLSFSFCFFVRFLFLLYLKEQLYSGWNTVLHYLFVCVCICLLNVRLLYDHFCTGREKF